jgi:hypothetical protein
MKWSLNNIFFVLGLVVVVVMLFTFDVSFVELWDHICRAGYWLIPIIGIWIVIYGLNALAWMAIIKGNTDPDEHVGFWRIFKLTITGYALNYATPVGGLGGEPYRIMELSKDISKQHATSSVILYAMMHMFSHFWFWLLSVALYIIYYAAQITLPLALLLSITTLICGTAIYLFIRGYRSGFTYALLQKLTHVPFLKSWATRFSEDQRATLQKIDQQIAQLHHARRHTFYLALGCELFARILSSVELLFFLHIFGVHATLVDSILMLGFTSLFANALFFLPMQLGAREGGFAMAASGLTITAGIGVSMGLLIRLRELVCVIIGLALIKIGNKYR